MRIAATILLTVLANTASAQDVRLFSVGSGDISGGYFQVAKAVCAQFNRDHAPALRCSPEPTAGSIYNLFMLNAGEQDFAIVQSDWQRAAYEGTGRFAGKEPMANLRSVMSLYPEMVTILARPDAGIATSGDLIGKTLDLGLPGSGRNATVRELLGRLGLDVGDFAAIEEYSPVTAVEELCAGHLDATVFVTGHPNSIVADALARCKLVLVPFAGPRVSELTEGANDFLMDAIPPRIYPALGRQIPTLAVRATLVTRLETDEALVAAFVKNLLDNLPTLKRITPLLRGATVQGLRREGLTAPLHPGADRVFAAEEAAGSFLDSSTDLQLTK